MYCCGAVTRVRQASRINEVPSCRCSISSPEIGFTCVPYFVLQKPLPLRFSDSGLSRRMIDQDSCQMTPNVIFIALLFKASSRAIAPPSIINTEEAALDSTAST